MTEQPEAPRRMVVTDENDAVTTQYEVFEHKAARAHLAATSGHRASMIQASGRTPDANGPGAAWIVHDEAGKALRCWVDIRDD